MTRVPGYAAAHRRIVRQRGPAADQRCTECGRPARYWCYDGADPAELHDPRHGRAYSLDPDRYRARCASCHRARSSGRAPLSQVGAARAIALYRGGSSLAQVAADLGVTRDIVRAALVAAGVTIRPRRVPADVDAERASALYGAGASLQGIAELLGVGAAAVRAALAARGVTIRRPGPTRRRRSTGRSPSEARAPRAASVPFHPIPTTSRQPSPTPSTPDPP